MTGADNIALSFLSVLECQDLNWHSFQLYHYVEKDLALPKNYLSLCYNSKTEVIALIIDYFNRQMIVNSQASSLSSLNTGLKITKLLQSRFSTMSNFKKAVKKLFEFLSFPGNTSIAIKSMWNTCDLIWHHAGDQSTDYNYYSKRLILMSIYLPSLLFFLQDNSDNSKETMEFIEKKIFAIGKVKRRK